MNGRRRSRRDERGMIVVIVGVSMMMIMAIAAIVIDVSFLRNDRRADQRIADAAATAGAVELPQSNGEGACAAAVDYLDAHIDGVSGLSSVNCETFHEFCDPSTTSKSVSGIVGDYRVEVVHPVPDWHPFMQRRSAIGAPTDPVLAADGTRCDRIGVSIQLARTPSFGRALGDTGQSTHVYSVAKADSPVCCEFPINLLILERHDCNAIVVDGQPWLVVGAVTGKSGELMPGILAVDSDGTGPTCGPTSNGTLHAQGTSALAQADGPLFCPAELVPGTGQGCGIIELYAPGVPGPSSPLYCEGGVYRPACTSTATVRPHPVRMSERRTRQIVDHTFNCQKKDNYSSKPWFKTQSIGGCPAATDSTDYIDELFTFAKAGTPTGWNVYGDQPASEPCTVDGQTTIEIPEGNTLVTCSPFTVKRPVTFKGGNVIFNGDVIVSSAGDLRIHACGQEGVNNCEKQEALEPTWQWGQDFDENLYSKDAAWVFFRTGGGFQKDARAQVRLFDSIVVLPPDADTGAGRAMALSGGDGALLWYAPREGPFDVLAMWSEALNQHDLGGSAQLEMEGVYFAPIARMLFRGNGGQNQVAAQLITRALTVSGGGTLRVVPDIHRSLLTESVPATTIIR